MMMPPLRLLMLLLPGEEVDRRQIRRYGLRLRHARAYAYFVITLLLLRQSRRHARLFTVISPSPSHFYCTMPPLAASARRADDAAMRY